MTPDGQFVMTRSTLSTMGDPGFGPYTAAGSWPPDQHGTYEIQAGGKIVMTYADGTVKTPAYVTAFHNGVLVQDHVALKGVTKYIGQPEYKAHGAAPILLQAHGDPSPPLSFRNIWLREMSR